ncbi:MAG: alpha/beta fold hydrolase [Leptospiraceae bacterium]|nr:alpha/beta fold hydrolase [Leptospiraceae bacterium]MDW7975055.1 alpha/beta fold hydrolase [Leptospiraceae bacterium]
MELHFLHYPTTSSSKHTVPIVILHGLFGSSKNWMSISKELSQEFEVFAIDARNHGNSPRSSTHTLKDMMEDLKEFIENHRISMPVLLGHSMGGLVAMGFSLVYPELIRSIIVVDIAPKVYPPLHQKEFEVLKTDISQFSSRQEIDAFLANIQPNSAIRQFLMMNLEKTNTGYQWKIHVPPLEKAQYLKGIQELLEHRFEKECLFIKATDSFYIQYEDYPTIRKVFPKAKIIEIKGNHWVHYTNPDEFLKVTKDFLSKLS